MQISNIVSATPNSDLHQEEEIHSSTTNIQIQSSIKTSADSQQNCNQDNNAIKIELKQNVAPADAITNDFKPLHKFKYQNQKKINWLEYIEEAKGMSEDIAQLCQNIAISSGTLSQPKQLSYSIFEAKPCKFELINNMISALPSDQAKGSPILQRATINCLPELIITIVGFCVKLILIILSYINSIYSRQNIGIFSCFNLLEVLTYRSLLTINQKQYEDFTKYSKKQLLIQSSELATTIPRILTSECGHSRPLKQQISFPKVIYMVSQGLFALQLLILCFIFMLTSQNSYNTFLQISNDFYIKLFYSISIIPSTIMGVILIYTKYKSKLAIQHEKRSILCNLRGFLLNDCYGLDYSDIHGISEGLCYMISENTNILPSVYFPYISVKDIQVHLEPYKMKITYRFTKQELQTIDSKHNERAREILKRGYDTISYDDILVWIIFQLQNDIKLWLPLSPTQLQNVTYQNSCLFGYTGSEISTLIAMIASQIQEEDDQQQINQELKDLKDKFNKISDFCRNYHRIRVDHIAEESLHVEQFDKVFIPLEEDIFQIVNNYHFELPTQTVAQEIYQLFNSQQQDIEMKLVEIIGYELLDTKLTEQLLQLRDKQNNKQNKSQEQEINIQIEDDQDIDIQIEDEQKEEQYLYQGSSTLFDVTYIPHTNKKPPQVNLLNVKDVIPDYFLPAFNNIKQFNNIQSQVFNSAFQNDQNLLISAPTGSGKTNIALLCILRLVQVILNSDEELQLRYIQYMTDQNRKVNQSPLIDMDFQCVYLTPLKALASEITEKFKESLENVGINVIEITGDTKPPNSIWQQSQVLIMTPQMMDVITRQPDSDSGLFSKLNLLIIDEIHQVGDKGTGPIYETIVMRTQYFAKILQKSIRIIGLSATIPNYQTFGRFIDAPIDNWKVFEEYYRPVPIDINIVDVKQLKLNQQGLLSNKRQLQSNIGKNNEVIQYLQNIEKQIENEFEINKQQQEKQEEINKHENVKKTKLKQKQFDYNDALDQISVYLANKYIQSTNVLLFVNSKAKTVYLAQMLASQQTKQIKLSQSDTQIAKTYERNILFNCLSKQIGFHNASLTKPQRQLVEKLFKNGQLKAVVCTATLVIGINAPAQVVIIRGTTFISERGKENLDMNMIKQVLGRAGRPQYSQENQIAKGIILTDQEMYTQYVNQFNRSRPIESAIFEQLEDIINSEIVLGTVTTPEEIIEYFKKSFAYLSQHLGNTTILQAIQNLINANIIKGPKTVQLGQNNTIQPTSLSRICSYSLISYKSLQQIIKNLKESVVGQVSIAEILYWISSLDIFSQLGQMNKQQNEELSNYTQNYQVLDDMQYYSKQQINKFVNRVNQEEKLNIPIKAMDQEPAYKISILIETFIQRFVLKLPQLITDQRLIMQQIKRVFTAVKELFILFKRGNEVQQLIQLENAIEYQIQVDRLNPFYGLVLRPLGSYQQGKGRKTYQIIFESQQRQSKEIQISTVNSLINSGLKYSLKQLKNVKQYDIEQELGKGNAQQIIQTVNYIPYITYYTKVVALNQNVLRIKFFGKASFIFNKNYHDSGVDYLILFQQAQSGIIIKSMKHTITQDNINTSIDITCLINIKSFQKLSIGKQQVSYTQYVNQIQQQQDVDEDVNVDISDLQNVKISIICESFPGLKQEEVIDLQKVYYSDFNPFQYRKIDQKKVIYQSREQKYFTPLPKVHSLSTSITGYPQLFKFPTFNPIQSVAFHKLFYSFENVYIGAPTSTGKTTCCEIAMISALKNFQSSKIIYIAPLKAIVNERIDEWKKFEKINVFTANLTGEELPDTKQLYKSRIICTTPEKFDAVTRFQQLHQYLNEVHLISSARGWILENVVARYVNQEGVRFIAMSTATSNVKDMMQWLNINKYCFFNFDNKARPLTLFSKIQGYIGEKFCERMEIMNKPVYNFIKQYNQYGLHTLVFVSSRKQTRKTGYALLSFSQQDVSGYRPSIILSVPNDKLAQGFVDEDLKQLSIYGIGIHHASLCKSDRDLVLQMYIAGELKLLICTSTLAFGINVPSYLTIIKGCEYYDKTCCQYADHDITTIQQMMGRAGRVQFIEQKYENMIGMYLGDEIRQKLKDMNIFKGMFTFDKQLILSCYDFDKTQKELLDKIEQLDQKEPKSVAIIMCKESMKEFYQQFMNDPLPFESSLINSTYGNTIAAAAQSVNNRKGQDHLAVSINALIASEITISFQDIILNYLHHTFYFLRARKNPQLYQIDVDDLPQQIEETSPSQLQQLQPYFQLYAPQRSIMDVPKAYLLDFFVCLQIYYKVEKILQQLIDYKYILVQYDAYDKQQLLLNAKFTATNLSISTAMYYLKIDTQNYFIENYFCKQQANFVEVLSFSEEFYEVPVRKEENIQMEKLYKEWNLQPVKGYTTVESMMSQYVKTHFLLQVQQNIYKIEQKLKQKIKYPTPEFQLDLNSILSNIPRFCSAIIDTIINQRGKVQKLIEIENFMKNIVTGSDYNNQELKQQESNVQYKIFGQIIKQQHGITEIQFETKIIVKNSKQLKSYITTPYYQFQKSRTLYVALVLNGNIIECQKINHLIQNQYIKQKLTIENINQQKVQIVFAHDIFKSHDRQVNINLGKLSTENQLLVIQ